jgi:hypothetical protein
MTTRRSTAGAALLATLCGIASVVHVQAGADNVVFPGNYAAGVKWLVIDKVDRKELHEHYATPAAVEAARRGQPMPSGTVFTLVRYAAQLDAQGNPAKDANGHFVKGDIAGFGVMEKRTGWGGEYPDTLRNGEWEYRVFTPDKKPNPNMKLTACFECHKAQADRDFVQAYDKLEQAAR